MIKIEKISKSYKGHKILENININIEKGEMVGIIGESGSGKSTLLNIIGLLEKPDSGSIDISGIKDIKINSKTARRMFRNKIGYLFQNFALIEDETVENNLKIVTKYFVDKKKVNKEIDNALEKVGLLGMKKKYVFQLSGGEQQRVALARIIIKPTDIILCDEPTGSLDSKNRDKVLEIIKDLNNKGKTIVIVTHDDFVASKMDRIIEIEKIK